MLNPQESRSSAFLFGSTAVGECDKYSDLDILIVEDVPSSHYKIPKMYLKEQTNIHYISWGKLLSIAEKGTPFFQHLQKDSFLLWDSQRKEGGEILRETKTSFPNHLSSKDSLQSVIQVLPYSPILDGFFYDVSFVMFRSRAIKILLGHGIRAFTINQILYKLSLLGLIDKVGIAVVKNARKAKSQYREGLDVSCCLSIGSIESVMQKTLGLDFSVRRCTEKETIDIMASLYIASSNPYVKIRVVEALAIILYGKIFGVDCPVNLKIISYFVGIHDNIECIEVFRDVIKICSDPQGYLHSREDLRLKKVFLKVLDSLREFEAF